MRGPLPAYLPRERVVIPGPTACPCCNGKLAKLGEDITETVEVIARRWKVIQTVRERLACRACKAISQPPAPFHPIARGRAGPGLLAMILEEKILEAKFFPAFAAEPAKRDLFPRRDRPRHLDARRLGRRLHGHAVVAGRTHPGPCAGGRATGLLHGDDTTVPVMAKVKTATGRLWTYVRDDRPFAGPAPPPALFFDPPDRAGEHPRRHLARYAGILPADAYAGYNGLYTPAREPEPVTEAACSAHGRRKLFDLTQITRAPLAAEAVRRIDAIFDAERAVNGVPAQQRLAVRQTQVAPLVAALEIWMRGVRATMSRHADVAKAMDYMFRRWSAFSRFLEDGRICLTNNAAERALRGVALCGKVWLFAGRERGGERAAAMYSLIMTAKLNNVDPRAWPADVLRRINDHPAFRLHELLPWNWTRPTKPAAAVD